MSELRIVCCMKQTFATDTTIELTEDHRIRDTGASLVVNPYDEFAVEEALLATGFPYQRDEKVDRNTTHVANFLKAGIVGATQATTVSPGHARELNVDALSFGLGGVIRGLFRPILGVVNGIDTTDWDPRTDPVLPKAFSAADLSGRSASRTALLESYGIEDGFVLGNVGRMSGQKGLGLIEYDLDTLVDEGVRFVFMGSGDLDPLVDSWVDRHPTAIVHVPFDEPASRLVFAGSDAYLMPSQFEPCGLGQIYAMRYGAPPIAHFTGGLEDTVLDIDEDPANGTGFVFRSFNHPSLTKTIRRAMRYRLAMPGL